MNTITLVGNVGGDPDLITTSTGKQCCRFRLAVSTGRRQPDGTWNDGPTSWYRVVVWQPLAANAHASLKRGQRVIVHGRIAVTEWTPNDGPTRRETEITADAIGPDLRFGRAAFARAITPAAAAPVPQAVEAQAAGDWGAPAPAHDAAAPAPSAASDGWASAEAEAEPEWASII